MCAYCDKKDTCDCRCDKNTDVIWGEITGELKDQTDLQAALDKHTADILTVDTLAHRNEQRLDAVEGTANEANQRSKDNLTRLDSVEGTAKTTKALADVHTTRLDNVEGVANGANTRSQDNVKRLDRVEGVANGAQALANNHTELINKVEDTAGTALQTAQLAQTAAEAAQATADNATQIANGKAAINHTHSSISLGSASVECVNGTSGDVPSPEIVLNGYMELCGTLQRLENYKRTRFEMPMTIEQILSKGKLLNEKVCEYLFNAIMLYYDNYDYEADGGSETLRMLSGENIYPIILSKYWHYGEKTAHAQHFKPWQVEFYDEIQSYDNFEGVVSIPVIRIHIGEDFAEWFSHFNPAGISDKVSYMEHRIGIDDIGKMPFSIYNASGTKLQEFTLI
jgi:hypothetical protein